METRVDDHEMHSFALRRFISFLVLAVPLGVVAGTPRPTFAGPRPSELCVDLLKASADGSVKFWMSGTGNSGEMNLRVKNELSVSLKVCVEVGTKLTPSEGDVQAMVVTREAKLSIKAEAEEEVSLEVACLDISKDPPSEENTSWRVEKPAKLVDFLKCVDGLLDDMKQQEPSQADLIDKARPGIVQLSLWQARGASRAEWIEFEVKYQGMTQQQAAQMTDALQPFLKEIVKHCGSLASL